MDEKILRNYARRIARNGSNIDNVQEVIVASAPEQTDFLEMLIEECYLAGAGKVTVNWQFQPLTKLNVQYQSLETLGKVETWG